MTDEAPLLQPTTLMAEMLFTAPAPDFDPDALVAASSTCDPDASFVQQDEMAVMIVQPRWSSIIEGKDVPPAAVVMKAGEDATPREIDPTQSWMFPGAAQAVAATVDRRLVVQMMGLAMSVEDRRAAFLCGLRAAITVMKPAAVWFPLTDQVLSAEQVMEDDLLPFVNVRMYGVTDHEDAIIMDTLGVAAFSLPDLQCAYRGLEPSEMASVLYNTAAYVLENGDIIADGHTISGPKGDEKWGVRHVQSVVEPLRVVLDIDPGEGHALVVGA